MRMFYHLLSRFREDVCTGKMVEVCDVRFEEACILYNIAALHSFLGCMDTRSNAEVITDSAIVHKHALLF